jgi:hypothetical protein
MISQTLNIKEYLNGMFRKTNNYQLFNILQTRAPLGGHYMPESTLAVG